MRKKLCICLSALLAISMLAGCGSAEFKQKLPWNKGKTPSTTTETTQETTQHDIQLKEVPVVEPGYELKYEDFLTLTDEDAAMLTGAVFVDNTGTVNTTFVAPEVEEETTSNIDIILQFTDGSEWGNTVQYTVKKSTPPFGETLYNSLQTDDWELFDATSGFQGSTELRSRFTYNVDNVALYGYQSDSLNFIEVNQVLPTWNVAEYTDAEMRDMALNDMSPVSTPMIYSALKVANEFILSFVNGEESTDDEQSVTTTENAADLAEMSQVLNWNLMLAKEISSVRVDDTEYNVIDIDGNTYPVKRVVQVVDATEFGGEAFEVTQCYYIVKDSNAIVFVGSSSFTGNAEENTDEESEESPSFASYEEFKQYAIDNAVYSSYTFDSVKEPDIETLVSSIILGDATPWIGDQEPAAEVQVEGGTTETTGDTESDQQLVDVAPTYQSQHPEIYVWPENTIKYRRWDYVINNETSFNGIIIMPDGTILRSNTKDSDYEFYGGQYSSTEQSAPVVHMSTGETYDLISAYGNYVVDSDGLEDIEYQTNLSTTGRLVFSYKGNRYFIETARASTINNYLANCIYNTDMFTGGVYEVQEVTERTVTDIGTITDYVIQFTPNGKTEYTKAAYMSVYTINSDYLVIYSEDLISDLKLMHTLLGTMVKVK